MNTRVLTFSMIPIFDKNCSRLAHRPDCETRSSPQHYGLVVTGGGGRGRGGGVERGGHVIGRRGIEQLTPPYSQTLQKIYHNPARGPDYFTQLSPYNLKLRK